MGIAPLAFTGVSQYSSDFQTILNRAVQVAQIPINLLQNKDSDLLQQKTLLGSLNTSTADLASSLESLGTIAANQAVTASSSDSTVVSVTNSGASSPATYTINSITSIASAASERSVNSYVDSTSSPVSSTGTVKLTVGAQDYTLTLSNNSLVGLRDQINALGAGVTASILTTGGGNYLSVSANATGATTLSLTDDPTGAQTALLTNTNQGTDAQFQVNGINVTQNSNLVNSVIPGVTFSLLKSSASPVTISLQSDRSQLSSALQDFVGKLNTLKSDLQAQTGKNAGLLSGSSIVSGLQQTLWRLTSYHTDTGTVRSLADLGIAFDSTGKASFDQTSFNALSDTQIADGFKFVGSTTSGLAGFTADLQQYSDPVTGLIRTEQDGIDRTDRTIQDQISTLSDRINIMQAGLSKRLAAADALAAQLQSQQLGLTASLQGLNYVLYGKAPNL
jgi:flagellar hook-associated protein 2